MLAFLIVRVPVCGRVRVRPWPRRLHTIMDCDKILGLSAGVVGEFAPPCVLLRMRPPGEGDVVSPHSPGLFHSLVNETGEATARALTQLAADAEAARQRTG